MKEYILFLDVSKNTPPSVHFCLGGCAIEKEYYTNTIIPFIANIKKEIFGDENIILHETELRAVKRTEYAVLRNKDKRELFWNRMAELFDNHNITVFSAVINPEKHRSLYNSKYLNDEYSICLEIVLEQYAHFLEKNNAIGSVCIESQNTKADNRLNNHYQRLVKRGTRNLNNMALHKHIGTLSFYMKTDLNIGLQIADFIPNTLKKYIHSIPQKKPNIESSIVNKLYDGCINFPHEFGVKNLN